ncbi:helix-turn-helix domain-containing protein [Actinomyces urogenitalis]|uniref:helix-turn-helix domain-containing protein n=1 Tax=Actinomyces urogenitalis TaxID=103621 RepID=UPI00242CE3A5|nr:helix-turn-helix domain-containing protein [Actinomyces urogenitalis]MCI7456353.1 helix-turn-helix domain-containing protein [Actinomyces urogenitalis]
MSFQATHWAIHEVHGVPNKLVLVVMAEYADENGECFPSQDRLARDTDLSVSTVRRTIRTYEALGLVTSIKRYVMSEDGSKVRTSNLYRLAVGAQPAATTTPEPVDNPPQDLPVNLTGRGEPVDNSATGSGLFVENTDTGQPDRKGVPTGQIEGVYRSRVTGISTPKHQIEPPNRTEPHQPGDELTPVGSGPVGQEQSASASPSLPRVGGGDAELIAQCLPAWMHPMDAPGAAQVAGLLRERIAAGWTRSQIAALMDAPAPPTVRRLSSLVGYRLRENVHPELAPTVLSRPSVRSQDKRDRQRAERADALAQVHHEVDPAWDAALDQARKDMPQASWAEVAVAARRLLADTTTAVPARPDRGTPPAAA